MEQEEEKEIDLLKWSATCFSDFQTFKKDLKNRNLLPQDWFEANNWTLKEIKKHSIGWGWAKDWKSGFLVELGKNFFIQGEEADLFTFLKNQ
jgi:hypothetical protein